MDENVNFLQDAKQLLQGSHDQYGDLENRPGEASSVYAQQAIAYALIALVKRLDKLTDEDNQAIRTVVLR